MGDGSPDWVRDAWRQTRRELCAFVHTAGDFALHPARFGRRWATVDVPEINPLGFAATAFGLVGVLATAISQLLFPSESGSGSIARELLSWLLPYAYFVLLGVIQHACLRSLFGSRRRLRDSCAMSLYAGGCVGMTTQLVTVLVAATLKELGYSTKFDFADVISSSAGFLLLLLASASILLFFLSLGAAQAALHAVRPWKVLVATVVTVLVSGFLFGYIHPPGAYGVHLVLRVTIDGGFSVILSN